MRRWSWRHCARLDELRHRRWRLGLLRCRRLDRRRGWLIYALEEGQCSEHVGRAVLVVVSGFRFGLGEAWREKARPTFLRVLFIVGHVVVLVVLVYAEGR